MAGRLIRMGGKIFAFLIGFPLLAIAYGGFFFPIWQADT